MRFLCSPNNCFFPIRILAFHPFLAHSQLFDWNSVSWHALIPKSSFTSFLQVTITTYDIIRQLAKSILRECLNIVCLFVYLFITYDDVSPSSSDETIQNGLYPSKAGCNISAASASNWQCWSTASFKHDFAAVNSLWMKIWL